VPWHVEKGGGTCGASQWAVIKDSDGSTAGCHPTKAKAEAQMAALYAGEDSKAKHLTPAIDVVRALGAGLELRHDEGAQGLGTLVLRFSRFNVWYEVDSLWEGLFLERTKPGAFKQTIREDRQQMRVLFNHGMDFQLGDKVLGPIDDLREEPDSPVGEVPLFDTSYNRDLLPGLEAGVYGSSMRMRVLEEKWDDEPKASDDNPKAIPERTILRVRVLEFGPVTFPANPDATAEMASAKVRSMTDQFYERLRQRDEPAFAAAVRAAGRPNFTGRPDARSAGGGDHDTTPGNGEASTEQQALLLARDRAWHLRRRLHAP
jgi:HK97 family phage prohead protease